MYSSLPVAATLERSIFQNHSCIFASIRGSLCWLSRVSVVKMSPRFLRAFAAQTSYLPSMGQQSDDLHIGTSGWSYASWKPAFFPEKLPSKRFLEFYATRLNAVELNATFRRMPTASAIAGWVGVTPSDFRFAAKVHQSITHFKRLKDCDDSFRFFLQSMEPMRQSGRLGPILIQTPPNLKADIDLLRTFAQLLPQAYRFALSSGMRAGLLTLSTRF